MDAKTRQQQDQQDRQVDVIKKDISDAVMARIGELEATGELSLPDGYSVGTALRSAFLIIQDTEDKNHNKALQVCTNASVANALQNMCIQGLYPEKRQCYFIVYGNQLQLFRSYFGTVSALKRAMPSVYKVVCEVLHKDDVVVWSRNAFGERYVGYIDNTPDENIGKERIACYCNIFDAQAHLLGSAYMTWKEIETSWKQSKTYSFDNSTHKKFPEEMAKRTLINKACKLLLNTSTESSAFQTAFAESGDDFVSEQPVVQKEIRKSFKERFNISKAPVPEAVPEAEPEQVPEEYDDMLFREMQENADGQV